MKTTKSWAELSPEQRKQIEINRSLVSVNCPFTGKNRAARQRLQNGFIAMSPKFRH